MNDLKDINPRHYKGVIIKGVEIQPADIIQAYFADDGLLSQAAKYMLRAGRKAGSSYLSDVGKALWWCARAILHKGGHIDLPPMSKRFVTIDGALIIPLPAKKAKQQATSTKRKVSVK